MRAALFLITMLAGCATTSVDRMYVGHDCRGGELTIRYVEVVSPWPIFDCPLELAIEGPIGCSYRRDGRNVIVVPVVGADAVREHEIRHLSGWEHPPMLPMLWSCARG